MILNFYETVKPPWVNNLLEGATFTGIYKKLLRKNKDKIYIISCESKIQPVNIKQPMSVSMHKISDWFIPFFNHQSLTKWAFSPGHI